MTGPTWARLTGAVLMTGGACLLAATLLMALGAWVPSHETAVVACPDGLQAVVIPAPVHPCPPPT